MEPWPEKLADVLCLTSGKKVEVCQADTACGIVISRQLWVDRKWDNESPRLADSSDGLATPTDKGGPVTLKPL